MLIPKFSQRTTESIVDWVTKNVGPVVSVWNTEELKTELDARKLMDAIYVFEGEENSKVGGQGFYIGLGI